MTVANFPAAADERRASPLLTLSGHPDLWVCKAALLSIVVMTNHLSSEKS